MNTKSIVAALERMKGAATLRKVCCSIAIDAGEWKEDEHKRDEHGRFAHYDRCREDKHDFSKEKKLIFTDFDGVLTDKDHGYMTARDPEKYHHVKELAERLKDLARRTGAKIVVASNWRKRGPEESVEFEKALPGKKFRNPVPALLEDLGDLAVGFLPNGEKGENKGSAFTEWQRRHPEFSGNFVMLDDRNTEGDSYSSEGHAGRFVKIDGTKGLTEEDAKKAEETLNRRWIETANPDGIVHDYGRGSDTRHLIFKDGKHYTIPAFADKIGLTSNSVQSAVKQGRMPSSWGNARVIDVLGRPVDTSKGRDRDTQFLIEHGGKTYTGKAFAEMLGVDSGSVYHVLSSLKENAPAYKRSTRSTMPRSWGDAKIIRADTGEEIPMERFGRTSEKFEKKPENFMQPEKDAWGRSMPRIKSTSRFMFHFPGEEKPLTQSEFARRVGMEATNVAKWFHKYHRIPPWVGEQGIEVSENGSKIYTNGKLMEGWTYTPPDRKRPQQPVRDDGMDDSIGGLINALSRLRRIR